MSSRVVDERRRDERFEQILGLVLRVGVLLAATVVLAGGVPLLLQHGNERLGHKTFHGEPAELRSLSGIVRGVVRFEERSIIMLGLLLLIATPVARVAFSVVGFARERDFLYVSLTLVVLGMLLYSLFAADVR
jgi:uncharacterized membrane protein